MILAILNVYPARVSRNFIFRSKQDSLEDRAAVLSTALAGFGEVDEDTAARVYGAIDFGSEESLRVVVTDASLRSVFDNSRSENTSGRIVMLTELRTAVLGNDVFLCSYGDGVITSRAAAPVAVGGRIIGAVYLYEVDEELGALLREMQNNLMRISLIACGAVLAVSLVISRPMARRINVLLSAIRRVREGEYGMHAEVRGNDEIGELAKEFNAMSDRLKSSEEMRRRFVSDASHELKTPLAAVRILVDSILGSDMPPEMIREFLEGIGDETDRLTRLTERLLNVSRLDAKKSELSAVDLAEVVRRVERNLRPLAESSNVNIELALDDGLKIAANSDDMYQIVFNLVENAVKYNRPGGDVHVYLYPNEGKVLLIVADTGVGIPQEDISRVFDRFYRVDKARSREAGGSGLGLSIVKTAVEQFGGEISVESTIGEGTRFTVSFRMLDEGAEL